MRTIIIMGAAGRDFHNFNVLFRNNPAYKVAAFTATQIPDIDGRCYPASLAGEGYPEGIPVIAEDRLPGLLRKFRVDTAVFSYSDISHETVMHRASLVNAHGANFMMLAPEQTMLFSSKPVIAVCAVRTGCGKSPVTRHICALLRNRGLRAAIIRHPMPYGDLERQAVQRFASLEDMDEAQCTIEEREEYEHHVEQGFTVFAGVDYARILAAAEAEADVIVWDGGNNDTPFIKPTVHVTVLDPLRPGHEHAYHPGETNLRLADIAIINKVNSAPLPAIAQVTESVRQYAPLAEILLAKSTVTVEAPELVAGKRVLLVEDGPTLTHGEMGYGAAQVAAELYGASGIADPRPAAVGSIAESLAAHPHIGNALPAIGYSGKQLADLEKSINGTDCDSVLLGTPIRLERLISINKPHVRVRYTHEDHGNRSLEQALFERLPLPPEQE
ncbi:cyclic 2,3-diphosphoglycerate synthase [Desulfovibrio mangrovi]|uniref:cyclic 2,3-diphosphoglycerate synthase n=1 Tax=Desulfovibrio mangrovi TaxID=2976983 RepID=UPI002247C5A5|nr:cyclic 2,3-diphosphoglycerate synthase [Desulfovibrio mangrovi]UZP66708.1 cyclic 2,3-diphosphoglycerate synthase [Desulfovibrio mangrovi]